MSLMKGGKKMTLAVSVMGLMLNQRVKEGIQGKNPAPANMQLKGSSSRKIKQG